MIEKNHIVPVIDFYNEIAREYDQRLTEDDMRVRKIVGEVFRQYVPKGNVLDFGSGTGLDLYWLLKHEYRVYSLEPSVSMRTIAKNKSYSIRIKDLFFLEENIDVNNWTENYLPCEEKMDGVLANFAVLNCIKDMTVFFERISLICENECLLIACILDARPHLWVKRYGIKNFIRGILRERITINNSYNGMVHKAYIHSLRRMRISFRHYFNFISYDPIEGSDFTLLILKKK
ncbi:MAG: methyltransferase domain-containing protein [Chitinophagaceae bacterium]|nr:MAG: methyltransferase domain-containing protein [Chitinophagaceae bacterium]